MGRLVDRIFAVAAAQPRAPAVEDARGALTFRELADGVARRRDELAARYPVGTRLLILLGNSKELPIWVLAASAAGLLPILADPRGVGRTFEPLIAAFRPRLLVAELDDDRLDGGARVVADGASGVLAEYGADLRGLSRPTGAYAAIATSGSTGRPKAVVLSDDAWIESATRLSRVLGVRGNDRALHVGSLAHGSGLLFTSVLLAGGANIVLPRFVASEVAHDAVATHATVTFLVPTMLYDLLERPEFAPDRLPDLRTVYYSGGPASAALVVRAATLWAHRLIQDYGLIEAPAPQLVLGRREHELLARDPSGPWAASSGRPLYPAEVTIGRPANEAGGGEITIRGPTLMSGYLTENGIDSSAIVGGVLATGDLAVQDSGGYVRIVGRASNVIATGGRKVSAEHVEHVLLECPGVLDVGVAGIPDDRWGEMLTAVVVPRAPRGRRPPIDHYARSHLAPHERPKEVFFVTELPRGAAGKIRRDELRILLVSLREAARARP